MILDVVVFLLPFAIVWAGTAIRKAVKSQK